MTTVDITPTIEAVSINGRPYLQVKCGQYIVGDYATVQACLAALRENNIEICDVTIKEPV